MEVLDAMQDVRIKYATAALSLIRCRQASCSIEAQNERKAIARKLSMQASPPQQPLLEAQQSPEDARKKKMRCVSTHCDVALRETLEALLDVMDDEIKTRAEFGLASAGIVNMAAKVNMFLKKKSGATDKALTELYFVLAMYPLKIV
jgi:hypothetical protein